MPQPLTPRPLPAEAGRGGLSLELFMTLPPDEPEKDWRASLPFPAHWLAYIAIKLVVLALVTLIALHYFGLI